LQAVQPATAAQAGWLGIYLSLSCTWQTPSETFQRQINMSRKGQPSRKGKKAWRRNVNLTDVEAALEDKLLEQRLMYVFDEAEKLMNQAANPLRKWRMRDCL